MVNKEQELDVAQNGGTNLVETDENWNNELLINPNLLDYGEKKAEIVDFCYNR